MGSSFYNPLITMNYFIINLIYMLPTILGYYLFPFTLIGIRTSNASKEFLIHFIEHISKHNKKFIDFYFPDWLL